MGKTGIAQFVVGAVAIAVGIMTGQPWLWKFGIASMASGLATAARYDMSSRQDAVLSNPAAQTASIPVVYGGSRVGGPVVDLRLDTSDERILYIVVAIGVGPEAGGGIQGITKIYFDDRLAINTPVTTGALSTSGVLSRFSGKLEYAVHLGTDAQTVNAALTATFPTEWPATSRGAGVAYLVLKLTYDEDVYPGGLPRITCNVQGQKVYDPRSTLTVWSTNPALIVRDYLTSKKYGCGIDTADIDETSFIDAANYCDEVINTAAYNGPRFTCNGVVDTGTPRQEVLSELLSSCRGEVVYQSGKFRLVIRQPTVQTSVTLTEDNIVGGWEFVRAGSDVPNSVTVAYIDPENQYQPAEVSWPEAGQANGFLTADNSLPVNAQIDLPFTDNYYIAQQIGMVVLREAREDVTISVTAKEDALRLQVGDVVPLTHSTPGFTAKLFWVVAIGIQPDATVRLVLREYDANAYTLDTQDTQPTVPGSNLPDPFTCLPPTNLVLTSSSATAMPTQDGQFLPRIFAHWDAPADPFLSHYEAQYKRILDTAWQQHPHPDKLLTETYITPVEDGQSYHVQVRAVNRLGVHSEWLTGTVAVTTRPAKDAVSLRMISRVQNDGTVDLYLQVMAKNPDVSIAAVFPVLVEVRRSDPDTGSLIASFSIPDEDEFGPADESDLGNITLPLHTTDTFYASAVTALGVELFASTMADRNKDPFGTAVGVNLDGRSFLPHILIRYDDDVESVVVNTPSGPKTYSGLSGGGEITYVAGQTLLDSATAERRFQMEETRSYTVVFAGGGSDMTVDVVLVGPMIRDVDPIPVDTAPQYDATLTIDNVTGNSVFTVLRDSASTMGIRYLFSKVPLTSPAPTQAGVQSYIYEVGETQKSFTFSGADQVANGETAYVYLWVYGYRGGMVIGSDPFAGGFGNQRGPFLFTATRNTSAPSGPSMHVTMDMSRSGILAAMMVRLQDPLNRGGTLLVWTRPDEASGVPSTGDAPDGTLAIAATPATITADQLAALATPIAHNVEKICHFRFTNSGGQVVNGSFAVRTAVSRPGYGKEILKDLVIGDPDEPEWVGYAIGDVQGQSAQPNTNLIAPVDNPSELIYFRGLALREGELQPGDRYVAAADLVLTNAASMYQLHAQFRDSTGGLVGQDLSIGHDGTTAPTRMTVSGTVPSGAVQVSLSPFHAAGPADGCGMLDLSITRGPIGGQSTASVTPQVVRVVSGEQAARFAIALQEWLALSGSMIGLPTAAVATQVLRDAANLVTLIDTQAGVAANLLLDRLTVEIEDAEGIRRQLENIRDSAVSNVNVIGILMSSIAELLAVQGTSVGPLGQAVNTQPLMDAARLTTLIDTVNGTLANLTIDGAPVETIKGRVYTTIVADGVLGDNVGIEEGGAVKRIVRGWLSGKCIGGTVSGAAWTDGDAVVFPLSFQFTPIVALYGGTTAEMRRGMWTAGFDASLPQYPALEALNVSPAGFTPRGRIWQAPTATYTDRSHFFPSNNLDTELESVVVDLVNAPAYDDRYTIHINVTGKSGSFFIGGGVGYVADPSSIRLRIYSSADGGATWVERWSGTYSFSQIDAGTGQGVESTVNSAIPLVVSGLSASAPTDQFRVEADLIRPGAFGGSARAVAASVSYVTSSEVPRYASMTPAHTTNANDRLTWVAQSVD